MPESSGERNEERACVTTEVRGDVCVVRCLDEEGRDLAADLRAESDCRCSLAGSPNQHLLARRTFSGLVGGC